MRALSLLLALAAPGTLLAQGLDDPSPHSEAMLVADVSVVQPGEPFAVALRLLMETGWHSYWQNPGDAGTATTIEWSLPPGFTADAIQWPYPVRIEVPPLVSYGYYDEVLLLVEIAPPESLEVGSTVALGGRADWLVCTDICLPAMAEVFLELPVRDRVVANADWTQAFDLTRSRLPKTSNEWVIAAERTDRGFSLSVTATDSGRVSIDSAYFFAGDEEVVSPAAAQPIARSGDRLAISLAKSPYATDSITRLRGVLVPPPGQSWDAAGEIVALAVDVPVDEGAASPPATPVNTASRITMIMALVFAFTGGMLLNLMPCVFPVLSLKVLGFAHQSGGDQTRARAHGLAFAIGVVLSFLALAALILVLRSGGARFGWGFQLQSSVFVAAMAVLFFTMGLSLMGVYEMGMWLTRLGSRVAQPTGYGDSIASGVLATLVATPCTAPFMGTALGFALTRSSVETLLVFGVLGLGMATPYVVLSMVPAVLAWLPRPGAWMETLKQLLAFPLFGTVIWLVWVFGLQVGMNGAAQLLIALMLFALAGWVLGRWPGQHVAGMKRMVTRAVTVAALVFAIALIARGTSSRSATDDSITWQPFSSGLVDDLRAAGQPVFVDFTAAWCITCKVNEQVILSSRVIEDAFREHGVAAVKADWTRFDAAITDALESFGRSGVPLYVLYPGALEGTPIVLPTILTKQGVIDALERIARASGPRADRSSGAR